MLGFLSRLRGLEMAWGTPTNIGTVSGSSGPNLLLSGVTIPAGALICVAITTIGSSTTGSVNDSVNGPTYTLATSYQIGAILNVELHYFYNSAALSGASLTYRKGKSNDLTSMSAFYVTGSQTSSDPLDLVTTPTGGSSTSPSITSGTPAASGELFVGAVGWVLSDTFTQASLWAAPPTAELIAGANIAGGYLVNAGAGAETYAPTLVSTAETWGALLVSFKVAAAAAFARRILTVVTGP